MVGSRRYQCESLEKRLFLSRSRDKPRGHQRSLHRSLRRQRQPGAQRDRRGIGALERVITDFNYSNGTNTYEIAIAMRGSGQASLPTPAGHGGFIGNKPFQGTMTIARGNDTNGDNLGDGDGWFPRPDALRLVRIHRHTSKRLRRAARIRRRRSECRTCLPWPCTRWRMRWAVFERDHERAGHGYRIVDHAPTGATFWAFEGPSVSHLYTGFDSGGAGGVGSDRMGTQHSATSSDSIFFQGATWSGATDLMNPSYQSSQRKLVDNVSAWALSDAFDYDVTIPKASARSTPS